MATSQFRGGIIMGLGFGTDRHRRPACPRSAPTGIGEIGITGVGAAVANAIYNATCKRVRDLPITLDKLQR